MILEPEGFLGGLWFLWNELEVDVAGRSTNNQIMYVVITMKLMQQQTWVLPSVYASTLAGERKKGWDENKEVCEICEAYGVVGEFNCVLKWW